MIARARRALPGMLVTILLATPALAAVPPDRTDGAGHRPHTADTSAHHRRATASVRHKPAPRLAAAAPQRHPRPPAHTVAFIDDGFSYVEKPGGAVGWKQTGVASWYGGSRWQGHRTSSGTIYDQDALTAAHATLPLGARIKVALHNSQKFVMVTITDRPGTRSRIIDLSRAAAAALGILDRGVAMVTLSPP